MKRLRASLLVLVVTTCATALAGCSSKPATIRLAAPTSIVDTGLLQAIVAKYHKATHGKVIIMPASDPEMLGLARAGKADVVVTDIPDQFQTMHQERIVDAYINLAENDLLIAGPKSDPGRIGPSISAVEMFQRLGTGAAPFFSRGDDSSVNRVELQFWKINGISHDAPWYIQTKAGMVGTLRMADAKSGYVLSDSATFVRQRKALQIVKLYPAATLSAIAPAALNAFVQASAVRHTGAPTKAGRAFIDFIARSSTQTLIGQFGATQYGQPLFKAVGTPAVKFDANGQPER